MSDATTSTIIDHTKKYNIPLNHLEHRYIQHCTDGLELERIYKELISGENGSHPLLEQLTLDRIRNIQPTSQILRQDNNLSNKSSQLDEVLNKLISRSLNDRNMNINSIPSIPVINNKQTIPKSNEEWDELQKKIFREFNSDNDDENSDEDKQSDNKSYEEKKRLHTAKQQFLNANAAFTLNDYQQAVDLYTKSIALDKNLNTYIHRAIAYYKLNNFDASIEDCSQILTINSKDIHALTHRASCYIAKKQYDQAKRDLDCVLTIDSDNNEAQNLLNTLLTIQQTNNNQITGDNEVMDSQTSIITSLNPPSFDVDDDQLNNNMNHSDFDPQNISLSTYDHDNIDQFQISSLNDNDDDDDGVALGGEAAGDFTGNISDDEQYVSRNVYVSSNTDDDSDEPALINKKTLHTPPSTPIIKQNIKNNTIHRNSSLTCDNTGEKFAAFSSHNQINDDYNDLNDHHRNNNHLSTISNHYPLHNQHSTFNSRINHNDTYMQSPTVNDAISNSNFGSIIQSWLRDLVASQSNHRLSSLYDRPWSRSGRPWSLDKLQHDIDRFSRYNDYKNVIEVSKKMLQNSILDYHYHTEYIVNTLYVCTQCYMKCNDYIHAIQYATETLQYDRTDNNVRINRAKAFQNEKFLLSSYADFTRIPTNHISYCAIQGICEKLISELNSTENETWREKLSTDDNEHFLNYLKQKTNYSENNSYEWYKKYADQFYLDACFILAIQYYTYCIELQPDTTYSYLKRAACYLKVYEPEKAINDCDKVLKEDKDNYLALYCKASAYKMSRRDHLYETTLKEYIKLQPHNQIILAEYYSSRHEQIPRNKRRIRILTKLNNNNNLTYEELEQIRQERNLLNTSSDFLNSNNMKEQCSFVLHVSEKDFFQLFDTITTILIEKILNICRIMIQAEEQYQSTTMSFSYKKFCFNILIELTKCSQIDSILSIVDENYRILLDELISYYASIYDDVEQLNSLKKL